MTATRVAQITSAVLVFAALAVRPAAAQWTPPIGIPAPSFGITNVARAVPNPWTASTPGFYYVDATIAASTDTSNTYGTPAKPRKTIPTSLPAGAVVELHGTYDTSHGSPDTIVSSGTASAPVFIRGVSATSRPLARRSWEIRGSYLIVENIEFGPLPDQSDTGSMVILLPSDHVAVRHNDVHGLPSGGGIGVVNWEVPYGVVYTGPGYLDNIVLWDNLVHDNGDLNATYDQDVHGISVTDHVRYLWVVDNQLYRNSGDGIQVNAQAPSAATTHHIYIGRNVSHHNKQTGYWIKSAADVVVSQNESYGHRPSNSSLGQCMGGQYGPDYVWFLYNHAHDCEFGITQMSDNQELSHWFLIGNIIENIHRSQASNPGDSWGPSAIMMSGGYERHVINNTIYNTDSGVNISTPVGTLEIADNIISTISQPLGSHVLMGFAQIAQVTSFHHNLLFGDPRIDWANGQIHLTAAQLTTVQSTGADPLFRNAAAADFHILANSPAKGAAELNSVYGTFLARYGFSIATDADGFVRPGNPTDMGAYLAAGQTGVAPVVTANPSDRAVRTGLMATFTAAASGTPSPTVQWQVSTNGGSTYTNIAGATSGTYSFASAAADNGKRFRATFSNAMGIATTTGAKLTVRRSITGDWDGDGRSEISTYTPGTSTFRVMMSGSNYVGAGTYAWGQTGDMPVAADYDGDGLTDPAVFRPSTAGWYILTSGTNFSTYSSYTWGASGDIPVPGDYDGDGKADIAVYRPSTGMWYVLQSSTKFATYLAISCGGPGDIPVPSDYDGDGRTDVAVYRPSTSVWSVVRSSMNFAQVSLQQFGWGAPGDKPIPGDFDGDGKSDIVVFRPSTATWFILLSSTSYSTYQPIGWGASADIPVAGDFDGDGKIDITVYRPSTGYWYILKSSTGYATYSVYAWGTSADTPLGR